jgi:hypothetical protein
MPTISLQAEAFAQLLALASHRAGRLRLSRQLRRHGRSPAEGLHAARRFLAEARQAAQRRAKKDAERRKVWLKAI